jgi:serine/threonine-protein kinase
MAYTSDESGQYEVYVKPYPELSGAWAISTNGGEEPIWSRDGKSLYYRNGDTWLEVPISFDPNFSMGTPRVVLEGPYINVPGRSYDLSADGSKFLVILDEGTEEFSRHVEVVLNWFDELERLVPTR